MGSTKLNMNLDEEEGPYIETDQWGRKWVDVNCKEFWQGQDNPVSRKQTKKDLRSLKEKGLMRSKRGAKNKKLYCIDEYGTERYLAKHLSKKTRSVVKVPCIEGIIEKKIALDLVTEICQGIENNLSYRLSLIV